MQFKYFILFLALILLTSTVVATPRIGTSNWSQINITSAAETNIYSLVTYDDGSGPAIFGGTYGLGKLFKYNYSLGGWKQVAASLGTENGIWSLTTYNDGTGNAIFGGTGYSGYLYKYNITLGHWLAVAVPLGSETYIHSLTTYDDGTGNAIFGGTSSGGRLFKYNSSTGTGAWIQVAAQLNTQSMINTLTTYDDGTGNAIFGGTYPGGRLFKYNSSTGNGTWIQMGATGDIYLLSFTQYNDGTGLALYGATANGGRLFKYNGSAWIQVANLAGLYFWSLTTYNDGTGDAVYGGVGTGGDPGALYKYNLTLGAWSKVAYQFNSQQNIYALLTYDNGYDTAIYGGTGTGGRLFTYPTVPPVAAFSCAPTYSLGKVDVKCNDASTNTPSSYFWSVENGTIPMTSTVMNPIFNMSVAGTYNVNMSATNSGGSSWANKTGYITIPATAVFSCYPTAGASKFDTVCTDKSPDPSVSWFWSVENGTVPMTSTVKNPIFNMSVAGTYNVNLSVTFSDASTNWGNKTGYIVVSTPPRHGLSNWLQVAASAGGGSQQYVYSLATYNDGTGNAVYGGTAGSGYLVKYNLSFGNWTTVATGLNGQSEIDSLISYDDGTGNAVYGGTAGGGRLFKYNTTLGGWSQVAAKLGSEAYIYSLTTYDDGTGNAIYGGTYGTGLLFKYNRSLGGWSQVATQLLSQTSVNGLTTYDDGTGNAVFGGTNGGLLFKYNISLSGWSRVATQYQSEQIKSLITYNDGTGDAVFGGTYSTGYLLKYNMSLHGWSRVAAQSSAQTYIKSLTTYDDGTGNAVFGGTAPNGYLLKYNMSLHGWSQVAAQLNSQSYILSLITYDDGNGNAIYGGTQANGLLFSYPAVPPTVGFVLSPGSMITATTDLKVRDTSSYTPTSWQYELFNDTAHIGWISSNRKVNISAGMGGNYTLNASATNGGGTSFMNWTQIIVKNPVPTARYYQTALNYTNTTTQLTMTDASVITNTSSPGYSWDFVPVASPNHSDNASTLQNPVRSFPCNTDDMSSADRCNYGVNHQVVDSPGSIWNQTSSWWNNTPWITIYGNSSPTILFTADIHSVAVSNPVQFTGTKIGLIKIDSWQWDFENDGIIDSYLQNPSHVYSSAGLYSVRLDAVNYTLGNDTVVKSGLITVTNSAPFVNFNATPTTITLSDTSYLVSTATGTNITEYYWIWQLYQGGSQNTSTAQNPTFIPGGTGLYNVSLLVTDSANTPWSNSTWENKTSYIKVTNNTISGSFNGTPTSGAAPLSVYFVWTSTGGIEENQTWYFGDGNISNVQDPIDVYPDGGTFSVNRSTCNDAGCVWYNLSDYISVTNPVPVVSGTRVPHYGNLTTPIQFTDTSSGINITGWIWDFYDDNLSYVQNPTHIFPCVTDSCIYDIGHAAIDSKDTPWEVMAWSNETGWVTIYQNSTPTASFTQSIIDGNVPRSIQFTATAAGLIKVDSYIWDFGDGSSGVGPAPIYVYNVAGQYTVALTATNYTLGQTTVTKTNLINVWNSAPTVIWNKTPDFGNSTTQFHFVDSSTGQNLTSDSYFWDWNEGNTSTLKSPMIRYPNTGITAVYDINHSVADSPFTPWENKSWLNESSVTIYGASSPSVSFTENKTSGYIPLPIQFTGSYTGDILIDSWSWDFGDGNYSSEQNPLHTYDVIGTFTVILTGTNFTLGQDISTQIDLILAKQPPLPAHCAETSWVVGNDIVVEFNLSGGYTSDFEENRNIPNTCTWIVPPVPAGLTSIEYLVVGGGGAGGQYQSGGGGGAGGFRNGTGFSILGLGAINVTVGWGGRSDVDGCNLDPNWHQYVNGTLSRLGNITDPGAIEASGGGSGGTTYYGDGNGMPGGSGGGGAGVVDSTSSAGIGGLGNRPVVSPVQGFNGGLGYFGSPPAVYSGGGGGGAAGIGSNAAGSNGGNGGYGEVSLITGNPVYYAGGGGGGSQNQAAVSLGGIGGGGDGGGYYPFRPPAVNGTPDTGGGGGGTGYPSCTGFGDGGSGVVILRYFAKNATPVPDFEGTPHIGLHPLTVSFTDLTPADPGITGYNWTFGDGNSSQLENPVHTYDYAGTFDVTFNVSSIDWPDQQIQKTAYITVESTPVVDWNATPLYGNLTTPFDFVDLTTGNITQYGWIFHDENQTLNRNVTGKQFPCTDILSCTYSIDHNATYLAGDPLEQTFWLNQSNYIKIYTNSSPTIWFTQDVTSGSAPLTVNFDGNQAGVIKIDSWQWDFENDGIIDSYLEDPSHIYPVAGAYSVRLDGINYTLGNDTIIKSGLITVFGPAPINIWTSNITEVLKNHNVQFTDSSIGTNIDGWYWDFNGTGSSLLQSPIYAFPTPGWQNVNHSVTDSTGQPWEQTVWNNKTGYIHVMNGTVTMWTSDVTTGIVPQNVQFTDISLNDTVVDYYWDFGDGSTSTEKSPLHQYAAAGLYSVSHQTYNTTFEISSWFNRMDYILIKNSVPVVNFASTPNPQLVGYNVQFTDISIGTNITYWTWTFGDAGTSNLQNPIHSYGGAGWYDISLTAYDSYGTPWQISAINISTHFQNIVPHTVAQFHQDVSSGTAPFTVTFTDDTVFGSPSVGWNWDFGDGGSSLFQNPSYSYTTAGNYYVCLTAFSTLDSSVINKTALILVKNQPPQVNFSSTPNPQQKLLNVQFNGLISGINISAYLWQFGDAGTSGALNPIHAYAIGNWYDISLTAWDSFGTNWSISYTNTSLHFQHIGNTTPSADFTSNLTVITNNGCVLFTDLSTGDAITDWSWNFGDGGTASGGPSLKNVVHCYSVVDPTIPHYYTVSLTVTNDGGSDTETKANYLYMPSSFEPVPPTFVPTPSGTPTVVPTGTPEPPVGMQHPISFDFANGTYLHYWINGSVTELPVYGFIWSLILPLWIYFGWWLFAILWFVFVMGIYLNTQEVGLPLIAGAIAGTVMAVFFPWEAKIVAALVLALCFAGLLMKVYYER